MSETILFIALALLFAALKVILDWRLAPLDAGGDEHRLDELAFAKKCSVYDIFQQAGEAWRFSDAKIDADFTRYVHTYFIPPYVRDYLRRHADAGAGTYHKLIFSGGRPPYL